MYKYTHLFNHSITFFINVYIYSFTHLLISYNYSFILLYFAGTFEDLLKHIFL